MKEPRSKALTQGKDLHAQTCKRCQRPILNDPQAQGHCILHAPIPDKDLKKFQQSLDEIIQPTFGAKIKKEETKCDFSCIHFPKGFNCRSLEKAFVHHCIFHEVTFYGEAFFQSVKFEGRAIFSNAVFSEAALFDLASFEQGANFIGATFTKAAGFMSATFLSNAYFASATFSGIANFEAATFSSEANFKRSTLMGMARFMETRFLGATNFAEANFSSAINFNQATFLERASFSQVKSPESDEVNFTVVTLQKPQEVTFHHLNLSRWIFLGTNLRLIDFGDVTWAITKRYWFSYPISALCDETHNLVLRQLYLDGSSWLISLLSSTFTTSQPINFK
ncbi:pentapeptide repeat-containing protein [Candidatus Acetothermia bacterium]|nr:pentapeptide repeat-containing protein [Candidatus Acetothermia bacterium]